MPSSTSAEDDYSLQLAALPLIPEPAPAPEGPRKEPKRARRLRRFPSSRE